MRDARRKHPNELGHNGVPGYTDGVRAAEIIEQIKRLPPADQKAVKDFCLNSALTGVNDERRHASENDFEKAADEVFAKYDDLLRKLSQ